VYFNGHGVLGSSGPEALGASSVVAAESGSLEVLCTALLAVFSFRSPGVVGAAVELVAAVLKSKAVPGVFGVLLADPNEANAPDPRPNAEEPAVVGEARLVLVKGDMALKGFLPPCDELSPPRRFETENVRDGASGLSPWDVDSESLLLLLHNASQSRFMQWAGCWLAYLERRVHRLSLLSIGNAGADRRS
jgi:hypothetical protein